MAMFRIWVKVIFPTCSYTYAVCAKPEQEKQRPEKQRPTWVMKLIKSVVLSSAVAETQCILALYPVSLSHLILIL